MKKILSLFISAVLSWSTIYGSHKATKDRKITFADSALSETVALLPQPKTRIHQLKTRSNMLKTREEQLRDLGELTVNQSLLSPFFKDPSTNTERNRGAKLKTAVALYNYDADDSVDADTTEPAEKAYALLTYGKKPTGLETCMRSRLWCLTNLVCRATPIVTREIYLHKKFNRIELPLKAALQHNIRATGLADKRKEAHVAASLAALNHRELFRRVKHLLTTNTLDAIIETYLESIEWTLPIEFLQPVARTSY